MKIFGFPDPVDETSARVVAGGVAAMSAATIALDQPLLLVPLTYGFAARVAAGPTLSPLGQLATKVVTPRIDGEHKYVPGPPKRLAQGIGLALSATASLFCFGLKNKKVAYRLLTVLAGAAFLESAFGICLACRIFPFLVRAGIVPESACEECADLWGTSRLSRRRAEGAE